MRNNLIEAIIGTIVLGVAGFFLFFAYTSGNTSVTKSYTLFAIFDRIDGLNVGSDIKLSGVKIGNIQKLEIDPKTYQAKVSLQIRQDIQLPTDSSAEVASESLLGGKYVALIPGGEEKILTHNQTIMFTQSSISFENLISKFMFGKSEDKKEEKKSDQGTAMAA